MKFFRRRCERAREAGVRFQARSGGCGQEYLVINVDKDTIEMASSSKTHGDDVAAESATSADHDSARVLPDIVTASGDIRNVAAEAAAASNHDTDDAVVADDVPAVSELVAEQESSVKPRDHGEAQLAESAQTPSVKIITSQPSEASISDLGQYDIFLITSDDDQENASKLASILLRFSKSCCDYDLTIHPELEIGENMLDHLRRGLARSKYRFIFIDSGWDDLAKFGTDAALMEMIHQQDQSIIPVKAHAGIGTPSLLRMFRPLDVQKLLNGKRLDDLDVDSLTESDVRLSELKKIVKMVSKSDFGSSSKLSSAEQSPRMTSQHSDTLRRHFSDLVDNMDPDHGLVNELFSLRVINLREMENIRASKTIFDRNEYLLRLLMRKSEGDYRKFIDALRKLDQPHIADILCCGSEDR